MTFQPLISVIVPVYNVEKYLKDCMASILCQTYTNLEVILVNDGSTDESGRLCDKYAKLDRRVKVIHKENAGPMSAFMEGAGRAVGEYMTFVDSDDWIETTMLEELAEQLTGDVGEMVCSNYIIEKKDRSIPVIQSMKPGIYDRGMLEKELFPYLLGQETRRIHYSRCMKLISKELVTDNLKYCNSRLTMGEDMNIILLCLLDAQRLVVMEKGLYYHYRFVDSSLVHKYNPGLYEMIGLLYDTLEKVLKEKENTLPDEVGQNPEVGDSLSEEAEQKLKKEYIFLFFLALKNELRGPAKGCVGRIQRMIRADKEQKKLETVEVEISGRANRLLYFIFKKPDMTRILLGRMAIKLFDRIA